MICSSHHFCKFPSICTTLLVLIVLHESLCFSAPPATNPSNGHGEGNAQVTGTVLNEQGGPVIGAQVYLKLRGSYAADTVTRTVQSTDAGRFTFDSVAPGNYRVWAVLASFSSTDNRMIGQDIHIAKGGESPAPIKITVHPGRTLHATITSIADGKPIAGATLHVNSLPDATTDAQGHATLEGITAITWDAEAFAPGKAKVVKTFNFADTDDISLDFALPEGGSLHGIVTDSAGRPQPGVGCDVYPGDNGTPLAYLQTSADGSYLFDHLPINLPCRILFEGHHGDADDWENFQLSTSKRTLELNIHMKPKPAGGSIAGIVVDPDGNPIPQARIIRYGSSTNDVKTVVADANGQFRLDGIDPQPGHQQIVVRAKGWVPQAVNIDQLGTATQPTQIKVGMREKGHTIVGQVVNDKGDPIKDVRIESGGFTIMDDRASQATTGADGKFSFDSLPANATFHFYAPGYSDIQWKHLPLDGADEVSVQMQPLAAIVGNVVDADTNQPLPKFNIKVHASSIAMTLFEKGEDFGGPTGAFRIDDLSAASKVMLIVSADGYPIQYFDDVAPSTTGQDDAVTFRLSKKPDGYVHVAGKIVDSAGKPIAGVEVRAIMYMPPDPARPRNTYFMWSMLKSGQLGIQDYIRAIESTRSAADGSFDFPSLKSPHIDLAYWGANVPQARLENIDDLPADQREHMNITISPPAKLTGKINRDNYPGITFLQLQSTSDPTFSIDLPMKEAADHYEFPPIPAGDYKLQINGRLQPNADGTFQYESLGSKNVTVAEGESKQLDLADDQR